MTQGEGFWVMKYQYLLHPTAHGKKDHYFLTQSFVFFLGTMPEAQQSKWQPCLLKINYSIKFKLFQMRQHYTEFYSFSPIFDVSVHFSVLLSCKNDLRK